jgi:hypothetical protein
MGNCPIYVKLSILSLLYPESGQARKATFAGEAFRNSHIMKVFTTNVLASRQITKVGRFLGVAYL